jgi:hypothetical protein
MLGRCPCDRNSPSKSPPTHRQKTDRGGEETAPVPEAGVANRNPREGEEKRRREERSIVGLALPPLMSTNLLPAVLGSTCRGVELASRGPWLEHWEFLLVSSTWTGRQA